MDNDMTEAIALHRWAVIAEATADRLNPAERGVVVRAIAGRSHTHPDGSSSSLFEGHDRPMDPGVAGWRPGSAAAFGPFGCRDGAGPSRAGRRSGGTASGAADALGGADRLDPVAPPRGESVGAHGAGPATPAGSAPRSAGSGAEGVRPLRGGPAERAVDHRRAGGPVGSPPQDRRLGAGQAVLDRRRPLPAVDRRRVLRLRERPGLPGPAAAGHRASRDARSPLRR